jgi:Spy/CpxP family protein refolding chaperone
MKILAVAALVLLAASSASAAPGDRFSCHVSTAQRASSSDMQERDFTERQQQNIYEIIIMEHTIVSRYTSNNREYLQEYHIMSDNLFDLVGSRNQLWGIETIAIGKATHPNHNNKYSISIIAQGSLYGNVWVLLCDKN